MWQAVARGMKLREALEALRLCGALQRLALAKTFSVDGSRLTDMLPHDVVLAISGALRHPKSDARWSRTRADSRIGRSLM